MGIQDCGVQNKLVAKSLARNLFMNDFARCLEVAKQDVEDDFKSLEKRSENNVVVELCINDVMFAFHCWVWTCFWLNVDPEQVPFPKNNAEAIKKTSKAHNQFVADASDDKTSVKPGPFTKDNKWDEWAKTFKKCPSLLPGSTRTPLACIIRKDEDPHLLPTATEKENFVVMPKLSGKTFKIDSEKVHICSLTLSTKHGEASSVVKGTGGDTKCGQLKGSASVCHHNGFGMHSQELVQAKNALQDLHHTCENQPHMCRTEFEHELDNDHSTVRRGCQAEPCPKHAKI